MIRSRLSPEGSLWDVFQRLRATRREGGFTLIDVVVCMGLIVILSVAGFVAYNALIAKAREQRELANGATPTPTPSLEAPVDRTPTEVTTPPDLTGLWVVLGVVAALVVLGILVMLFVMVIRKTHHSAQNLRYRKQAAKIDHEQALGIWQKSVDRHRELKNKVVEIETDWDMIFQYPTLVDSGVPATREFHRALRAVDDVSPVAPAGLTLSMDISGFPYPRLVSGANEAWLEAWSFAQRTGTKLIPREERKNIDQIVKLLKLARDGGGSEHERAVAYERASKLVSELNFVKVPAESLKALGAESRLMLEGGPSAQSTTEAEKAPAAISL